MKSDDPAIGQPVRHHFTAELDQIRMQVELMAMRVTDALRGAHTVLETGDVALALKVVAADDDIDGMFVSLTERCYDLIRRESPVASDLRLVVSVIRILEELERIGDLALRTVKTVDDHAVLAAHADIVTTLLRMSTVAQESFAISIDAWSSNSVEQTIGLAARERVMDEHYSELTARLLSLSGDDAAHVAITAVLIGRAFERISDHAVVIGERVGYLLTGDPRYLASEIR